MALQDSGMIAEGRHLRLRREADWEYVERKNINGVAIVAAMDGEGRVILVEQFRMPVHKAVIELPAGLSGDLPGREDEPLVACAGRELLEETGFEAQCMRQIIEGPVSPGMSTECVTFFLATGLRRVRRGGGDDQEDIRVHLVPMEEVGAWLGEKIRSGVLVDPKVYTGLYFLEKQWKRMGSNAAHGAPEALGD